MSRPTRAPAPDNISPMVDPSISLPSPMTRPKRAASVNSSFASPTPSTASVGSPFTTPAPTNRDYPAEDSSASLLRNFRGLSVKYPPAPAVSSEIDSTITNISTPETAKGSSTYSTPVVDLRPTSSENSSNFITPPTRVMDPRGQPAFYINYYYVPGQPHPVPGLPISYPAVGSTVNANDNVAGTQDSTLRPIASDPDTTPRATSTPTDMDICEPATDVSSRMNTDNTVQSAVDVSMQSAINNTALPSDAVATDGYSRDVEMNEEEADEEIFGPIRIKDYAKSCELHNEDETTLGLPQRIYKEWKASGYVNNWMEAANVPDTILRAITSRVKLENLILKDALKLQDELYIRIKLTGDDGEVTVEKFGRIVDFHNKYEKKGSTNKDTKAPTNKGKKAITDTGAEAPTDNVAGSSTDQTNNAPTATTAEPSTSTSKAHSTSISKTPSTTTTKPKKSSAAQLPEIALFANGAQKGELKPCTGPTALLEALSELEPKTPKPSGPWKALKVRRGGGGGGGVVRVGDGGQGVLELGTLDHVRQRFHRWEIEMDAWGDVMQVEGGRRRRRKGGKGNGKGKIVGDGDEDEDDDEDE